MKNEYVFSDNVGQNIVYQSIKFSKIGVYLKCFTAYFLQYSSTAVKIWLSDGRLENYHQFQVFQGFS